jgi:hypothetical protein
MDSREYIVEILNSIVRLNELTRGKEIMRLRLISFLRTDFIGNSYDQVWRSVIVESTEQYQARLFIERVAAEMVSTAK